MGKRAKPGNLLQVNELSLGHTNVKDESIRYVCEMKMFLPHLWSINLGQYL